MSAAIYFSCGALVAAALSVAIWVSHRNFLRTVGRLPPKVIYGYDYRGELDKTVVVWKTPTKLMANPDIDETSSGFFAMKWFFATVSLFLAATAIIKAVDFK